MNAHDSNICSNAFRWCEVHIYVLLAVLNSNRNLIFLKKEDCEASEKVCD